MKLEVNDLGSVGLIQDVQSFMLTPEAWSSVSNARMNELGVGRIPGESEALGTATAAWSQNPVWLAKAKNAAHEYWVGLGTTKAYARGIGGSYTETEITRVAGPYAATEALKWNTAMMEGIFIANNTVDQPQYWGLDTATPMLDLNNIGTGANKWPANYTCGLMLPFDKVLIALDVTKAGTRYQNLVKWSHACDPGSLPQVWDPTNPSFDAGEWPLAEGNGPILDAAVLGSILAIYKEDFVHYMKWIGGEFVFDFGKLITTQGLLARHCVTPFGRDLEKHFCVGRDDIYVHNGQAIEPVAERKFKRTLFNTIDVTNYARSFVVQNRAQNEVWFCYPESGEQQPTMAVIWNWVDNSVSKRELLKVSTGAAVRSSAATRGTPCIAAGTLVDTGSDPWSGDSASWSSDTTVWDQNTGSPLASKLFMLERSGSKLTYLLDDTYQFDGTDYQMLVERQSLAITDKDFKGNWIVDTKSVKLITDFWPHLTGEAGTVVYFSIGVQDTVDAAASWSDEQAFTLGSSEKCEFYVSGRMFGVRMRVPTAHAVQLQSYEIEVNPIGRF